MSNTANRNGFADALNRLNTVMEVGQSVDLDILEDAAKYFAAKLRPMIPRGTGNTHLQDELEIKVMPDKVQLVFNKKAWYWHLANKGHKKPGGKGRVQGSQFLRKALDKHGSNTADLMRNKILERMEG